MILDAGFLISVDRSEPAARTFLTAAARADRELHTSEPVVAQVWRDGAKQARLAAFLKTIAIHPLNEGRLIGQLLGRSNTTDVVDAHLVLLATRLGHDVLTGDPGDISVLAAALGASAPHVHPWPRQPLRRSLCASVDEDDEFINQNVRESSGES